MPPSARMYQVVPGPVATAAAMVIAPLADFVCAGLLLSVTVVVKVDEPVTVGLPEMTPVVAARVKPAGRLPEVIDQV